MFNGALPTMHGAVSWEVAQHTLILVASAPAFRLRSTNTARKQQGSVVYSRCSEHANYSFVSVVSVFSSPRASEGGDI